MALRGPTDRLDRILVSRGLAENRSKAQALVLAGRVTCRGVRLEKPGIRLAVDAPLEVRPGRRYVSRGAHKLSAALDCFAIEPAGRVALDVGASTGGFTQVLLERGASRVIALDVGRGQLDWSLRQDPRVHPLEGLNARYLKPESLPAVPSLAVIDVSFISTELVLPAVVGCLSPDGEVATLIKPQFEVGRGHVGRGGVVRDPERHREVLVRAARFAAERGWGVCGLCASPLPGAEGNREFFLHLRPAERGLDEREVTAQLLRALAGASPPGVPPAGGSLG